MRNAQTQEGPYTKKGLKKPSKILKALPLFGHRLSCPGIHLQPAITLLVGTHQAAPREEEIQLKQRESEVVQQAMAHSFMFLFQNFKQTNVFSCFFLWNLQNTYDVFYLKLQSMILLVWNLFKIVLRLEPSRKICYIAWKNHRGFWIPLFGCLIKIVILAVASLFCVVFGLGHPSLPGFVFSTYLKKGKLFQPLCSIAST